MNGLIESLKGIGTVRLVVMATVAAGLLAVFAMLAGRLAEPKMALLYGEMEMAEAGEIVAKLEAMSVPVELRGNASGAQVYVPADQVLRLRMSMAESGLPSRGSMGYELFDRSEGLGTTSFVQNINHLRALEGELARTIRTLDRIQQARVHLVLPRRELFSREAQEPSASIILRMRGGRLDSEQVQAIQNLVASAVPALKPDQVAIIDERGTLLSRSSDQVAGSSGYLNELRRGCENRVKQSVEALVEQSVGIGRVRAEVSAQMNFDRTTTNAEVYDPDSRVARSTQTVEESSQSQERQADGTVTVKNNLPEGQEENTDGPRSTSQSQRTEETVNYELSRTVTTRVHESGSVERLSVAVLVDGVYEGGGEGQEPTYRPRTDEELAQIRTLVRSAIGYDEARGDSVEVVNMRFARLIEFGADDEAAATFMLGKDDYIRIAEIAAFLVVGLLVVLLVLRPLLVRRPAGAGAAAGGAPQLGGPRPVAQIAHQSAGMAQLAGPDGQAQIGRDDGHALLAPPDAADDQMIDIDRIEGQVRASSLRKLGELVDKHPEEAVSIVRSWMYQDA